MILKIVCFMTVILPGQLVAQPGPILSPSFDQRNRVADPVDIPTGLYERSYIDIAIYDTVPVMLKRQYRNLDPVSRAFGIGTSHIYDWYLWTNRTDLSFVDLIREDGSRVHYVRKNAGSDYQQAVFVSKSAPDEFLNSEMRWDAGKWALKLPNGIVYKFLACGNHTRQKCKLVEYQKPSGGWLRMTRDADSHLLSVVNSSNRGIRFQNDSKGRIVEANVLGSNKVVKYEYDDLGRLKRVAATGLIIYGNRMTELAMVFMEIIGWLPKRIPESIEYEYDASHNMVRMKDSTGFEMVNKYDFAGRTIHQKLNDGRTWSLEYKVDKGGNILQTDITNPDGTIERVTFDVDHNTLTETYPFGLPEQIKWIYERDTTTGRAVAIAAECVSRKGRKMRYHEAVGPDRSIDHLKDKFRASCKSARETQ